MRLNFKALGLAVALVVAIAAAPPTPQAKELHWAFQGDIHSMDPYSLNETFSLGTLGNVYEGLVRRTADLKVVPALAVRWELKEPTRWRVYLRHGVTFHDGRPFTADDVVFSYKRATAKGSDVGGKLASVTDVRKVDRYTVDFITSAPNPIITSEWETWMIMSKGWADEHQADMPEGPSGAGASYAHLHENGTGPYTLVSREADVKSVFKAYPKWWDAKNHKGMPDRVVMSPIASASTRVAALLSGNVAMAYPIPVQDMKRVDDNAGTHMLVGPEVRTIYLGMDMFRDELLHSNVKGKNPFKDKRVRQAFYQAIDEDAIAAKVMRGLATPTAIMVAPGIIGYEKSFKRLPYDPEKAKALLTEAGYPDGFELHMDCPNDRYVNDAQICQAVVGMLAKVGVKVDLLAQPKAIYFGKILPPKLDTDFYLIGWQPDSFDSWNPLYNLLNCPEGKKGRFNLGGYCNHEVDKLTAEILSETNQKKRAAMLHKVWGIVIHDIATIPLHQQALAWGVSDKITVKQRADNVFHWYHVDMK
ncbi:MAG TPA: ABC transporter substrate-binding protein [bacterium]|nr:ABC transporter substrate-binding protein [bacterium]